MKFCSMILLIMACAFPYNASACSCAGAELQRIYESSPNVFTAVVTGGNFDDDGNIEADFEVTESFKGQIPFDKLRTTRTGSTCDTSITIGLEYLFFMGNDGRFGGCPVRPIISRDRPTPWLVILQAYKAGETPNLSSPWYFNEVDGLCSLRTNFRVTPGNSSGVLDMEFRHTVPENRVWTSERMKRAGSSNAVIIMTRREESVDAQVILKTHGREYIAKWARHVVPGATRRGAFQMTGEDVTSFAEELLSSSEVHVGGSFARYRTLDGAVIRTTNASSAILDFVNCATR
jgi:hypothetical protein